MLGILTLASYMTLGKICDVFKLPCSYLSNRCNNDFDAYKGNKNMYLAELFLRYKLSCRVCCWWALKKKKVTLVKQPPPFLLFPGRCVSISIILLSSLFFIYSVTEAQKSK